MEYRKGGTKVTVGVEVAKEQLKEQQNIDKIPSHSPRIRRSFSIPMFIFRRKSKHSLKREIIFATLTLELL